MLQASHTRQRSLLTFSTSEIIYNANTENTSTSIDGYLDSRALDPVKLNHISPSHTPLDNTKLDTLLSLRIRKFDWNSIESTDSTYSKFRLYRDIPAPVESNFGDGFYDSFIKNMIIIKKVYSLANNAAKRFSDPNISHAISNACNLLSDQLDQKNSDQTSSFWPPIYSGGCRTPFNMNINGVIAATANQLEQNGVVNCSTTINANDHVNSGQSTNDTIQAGFILTIADHIDEINKQLNNLKNNELLKFNIEEFNTTVDLLINIGKSLKMEGLTHLPLLATAAGTGSTAQGLESHLYPILNSEMRALSRLGNEEKIEHNPNLTNATVDCSWYVKVENFYGQCASLLSTFNDISSDMQFLLEQVKYVGNSVMKLANEKGGAFNLNSMDPQMDWTLIFDFHRLSEVFISINEIATYDKSASPDPRVATLVRPYPENLTAQSNQLIDKIDKAIDETLKFASKAGDLYWLLYTEHQPAVVGKISDTLEGYAAEYQHHKIQQTPTVITLLDSKNTANNGCSLTMKQRFDLDSYLSSIDLLLASFERTAKDFTQRNKERGLTLETVAPGSSIMPGKVNPVICELIQMMTNQASAQICLLKNKITDISATPHSIDTKHAAYQIDSIHRCAMTAAECIQRLMLKTKLNDNSNKFIIDNSGSLATNFRGKKTKDNHVVDYATAASLNKALKLAQETKPSATFYSIIDNAGKEFENATGETITITASDIAAWSKDDIVGGIVKSLIK